MTNVEIKVNSVIAEILEDNSFNNFSISELKDAYINLAIDKSQLEARKFVYRQVLRLVECGVLSKESTKKTKGITYRKTDLFTKVVFIKKKYKVARQENYDLFSNTTAEIAVKRNLEDKLYDYTVDMIAAKSESEEYVQLAKSFPEMKEQLKEKYQLARDRSSKLLGKIKAINTMIYLKNSSV